MSNTKNINILYDSRNYTILKHNSFIYCYSYQNVVAYYDYVKVHSRVDNLTQTNKKHIDLFKKFISENL